MFTAVSDNTLEILMRIFSPKYFCPKVMKVLRISLPSKMPLT
ncbi:hypothetical protein [Hymenobacter sp. IS2118]|nr:hypothetical protein [Hymenobacter sp. IS2118]